MKYFAVDSREAVSVFDTIQAQVQVFIDFRYIEFKRLEMSYQTHLQFCADVSQSLEEICSCGSNEERLSKSFQLKEKCRRVQEQQDQRISAIPITSRSEDFLNNYLADRIRGAVEDFGFTVLTNKSVIGIQDLNTSRFGSSRPDLLMFSNIGCTGIVVTSPKEEEEEEGELEEGEGYLGEERKSEGGGEERKSERGEKRKSEGGGGGENVKKRRREEQDEEEIHLFGSVSENKLHNENPEPQLLANMEKLAGVLAYRHLKSGKMDLRYITIYGLIIRYDCNESTSYKLTMDFANHCSEFFVESTRQSISHNVNRLVWQMKCMNRKQIALTAE